MAAADNSRFLAQAAAERHQATVARAQAAIEKLDRSGHTVTFSAIAQAAGVSRSWLYRHPDTRDLITRLRSRRSPAATTPPAAQQATTESLRQRLHTTRAEISSLRAENIALRDQLARRTNIAGRSRGP